MKKERMEAEMVKETMEEKMNTNPLLKEAFRNLLLNKILTGKDNSEETTKQFLGTFEEEHRDMIAALSYTFKNCKEHEHKIMQIQRKDNPEDCYRLIIKIEKVSKEEFEKDNDKTRQINREGNK